MKITIKIIVTFLITLFLTTFIPNIIIRVFFSDLMRENFSYNIFFIMITIASAIALLIYSLVMHFIVVKRIKSVSQATQIVAKGTTNIHLREQGNDEISVLIRNFNLMVSELESNQYLNKEFARNYSHELKTPLSTIKGYAELIEMGDLSQLEINEYAQIIIKESQRLANMSSIMMQISLLDTTTIISKEDYVNIGEQIRNVIALMQVNWESKKNEFVLDLSDLKIRSNQSLLFHVWQNLISNAINFSKTGGQIEISVKPIKEYAQIIIKDYGVGISSAELKHIFDLFYVSSSKHFNHSNGIGLTLVKKAVERLGGTITVTSELNEPTIFIVLLPLNY